MSPTYGIPQDCLRLHGGRRGAAIALERAIYGDLFPVVPNSENGNNSAAIN